MVHKREKGKAERIAEAIRADIISGKMRPGDRIKSLRELAKDFGVSLNSAQCAMDNLFDEGMVERQRGSGTFVSEIDIKRENTVYFLVPHLSCMTSASESSIVIRRILYGLNSVLQSGQLLQIIPAARENVPSIIKNPQAIDWASIEKIPEGANVLITNTWYGDIIPYLNKKGIRGVFLSIQYEESQPQIKEVLEKSGWPVITADRFSAIQKAMSYLYNLNKKRTVVLKKCENEPLHPFRLGFETFMGKTPELRDGCVFREYSSKGNVYINIQNIVTEMWNKASFDSIILCSPELTEPVFSVLGKKLGLSVPGDVSVISYRDLPEFLKHTPTISSFDFSWSDMGAEAVRIFNNDYATNASNVRFQASIIERGSTIENLDGTALKNFMPELITTYAMNEEII